MLILFAIGLLILSNCSERGHNNPFDPEGNSETPLTLSLNSFDNNSVNLSWGWESNPVTDYSGFRIYRSVGNDHNFTLYHESPKSEFSFSDTSVQKYNWVYYKISVFGPSVESALSKPQKIYLGQGVYWILSSYGFWVRKVSYDLQRAMKNYYTTYPCQEWAVSLDDSLINLAYIRFSRGVSQLNLKKGVEDFFYSDVNSPIDVEYDAAQKRMFVLDSNGDNQEDEILVIKNKALERKIILPKENYLKLYLSNQNHSLVILGETKYYELSTTTSTIMDSVLFSPGFIGQDVDVSSDSIYILTYSEQTNMSKIYKTDFQGNVTDSLITSGHFYRITFDKDFHQFYLAEEIDFAQDKLVKLSSQGVRQFELSGFEYIEQIGLNPYDHSFVVINNDPVNDQLILYDSSGNEISRSKTNSFYDPIRIFFE